MNSSLKNIVKRTGADFFWGMRVLPKAQREAMYTIFAFHHHLEKVAYSLKISKQERLELIETWRQEFDNIFDKKVPETKIGRKIYKNCMRFKLPKSGFLSLLDSLTIDIEKPIVAPSNEIYETYIYGVATMPCNFFLRIQGIKDENILNELSETISKSVMTTSILKNMKDAAKIGRVYIPEEVLRKAEIYDKEADKIIVHKNLNVARQIFAEEAEKNFMKIDGLLRKIGEKDARHIRNIMAINRKYFEIMRDRGWEVISPKPKIGSLFKISLALKFLFRK